MNKLMICLVFLFALPFAGHSQDGEWMKKPAEERAQILTDWMVKELQLSEEQQSQTYDINLKYAEKGDDLRASTGARREKFQKVREYADAKDNELKAVFTDEQYSAYQDRKSELRKKVKEQVRENRQ